MFLDSALELTSLDFRVFPLLPGQKIPAVAKRDGGNGCNDATDDEEIIADWSRKYPRANIGVGTGRPSGCIVIDLDPRNGSDDTIVFLASRKQTFPETVTAKTANGGTHLYYAYEPELEVIKNSKSVLGPGIDVKTTGGYVVAPPSVLDGGKRYVWINRPLGGVFPRMPKWASEALKPRPEPKRITEYHKTDAPKDLAPMINFVANAPEGQRNDLLFWAAMKAARQRQEDQAYSALEAAGRNAGLDAKEVKKAIQSGFDIGKQL